MNLFIDYCTENKILIFIQCYISRPFSGLTDYDIALEILDVKVEIMQDTQLNLFSVFSW